VERREEVRTWDFEEERVLQCVQQKKFLLL